MSPFSAAEVAGILVGDEVVAIDGVSVVDASEDWARLTELIRASPGEVISLSIERGGDVTDIEVVPGFSLTSDGAAGFEGLYLGDQVVAVDGEPVDSYAAFAERAGDRIGGAVDVTVVYQYLDSSVLSDNNLAVGSDNQPPLEERNIVEERDGVVRENKEAEVYFVPEVEEAIVGFLGISVE